MASLRQRMVPFVRSGQGEELGEVICNQLFLSIYRGLEKQGRRRTFDRLLLKLDLFAVDELVGLITAVSLVRPSKDIRDVQPKSIKKKWKDKAFAKGVNREDIEKGAEDLGVPLSDHIALSLEAMKSVAADLGLDGVAAR